MFRMARLRTHSSEPEQDSGCECDGREEDRWAPVVAGRDAAPVLQTPEHDLDAVASPVATLVVTHGCIARLSPRNAGLDALRPQGIPEPVSIIAAITEQPLGLGQLFQKRSRPRVVADLSGGQEEAQGPSVRIGHGVKLGVHPTFGAADQASKPPF